MTHIAKLARKPALAYTVVATFTKPAVRTAVGVGTIFVLESNTALIALLVAVRVGRFPAAVAETNTAYTSPVGTTVLRTFCTAN